MQTARRLQIGHHPFISCSVQIFNGFILFLLENKKKSFRVHSLPDPPCQRPTRTLPDPHQSPTRPPRIPYQILAIPAFSAFACYALHASEARQDPEQTLPDPTRPYQTPTKPPPDACQTVAALPGPKRRHACLPPDPYQCWRATTLP